MQTIKIDRGFYTNTLTEIDVYNLLSDNSALKSILLMILNNDDYWENEHEVEFDRKDAYDYLIEEKVFKGFSKKYIKESLIKILK